MILMMGQIGTGKGTQGHLLAKRLECPWVSTGELLRARMTPELRQRFLGGKLVGDKEMFKIAETEFKRLHADTQELILDGFPRTLHQARWIVEKIKAKKICLNSIIFLYAPKDVIMQRLLKRGRVDDNATIIEKRFKEIDGELIDILEYFQKEGFKVNKINAEPTVEDIADNINQALETR
jgi:adenylate kinase